jgi:hypothetical protein
LDYHLTKGEEITTAAVEVVAEAITVDVAVAGIIVRTMTVGTASNAIEISAINATEDEMEVISIAVMEAETIEAVVDTEEDAADEVDITIVTPVTASLSLVVVQTTPGGIG